MDDDEDLVTMHPFPAKADLRPESPAIKQKREKSCLMKRA